MIYDKKIKEILSINSFLVKALYSVCILSFSFTFLSCTKNNQEVKSKDNVVVAPKEEPIDFDLIKIKERGSLIAILDNSSTGYFIYKGHPMGYEYELLNLLAQDLGVELELMIVTDLEDAFLKLNRGEGDIIAHNLTITNEREDRIAFTHPHNKVGQVLVQRKPDNWKKLDYDHIEASLIREPHQLIGKQIYARKSSAYLSLLKNLSKEVGGKIIPVEDFGNIDTESLIKKVAAGEIDYTIADENVAKVNQNYYNNIDIQTRLKDDQKIAWAVRKTSPELLEEVNSWIRKMKKKTDYYVIYKKYFESSKATMQRAQSNYASFSSDKISPYDDLLKEGAAKVGWDWRLLASIVYQESKFQEDAESPRGAFGLMQLMPETAIQFGAKEFCNPKESIKAGTNYLVWLNKLWAKKIPNEEERVKFILASYNAGQGHVLDARKLAVKDGKDPQDWSQVEYYLLNKSQPKFYNDPVVKSGYCRGEEPVKYVKEVINRFEQYKLLNNG
ncbi:MAG: transporter substrate-binding domain-containing protein [Bacteroidota bacterium]|nr:transporter substrate-binding domain-containing protein [Bacteroidota bacterium]